MGVPSIIVKSKLSQSYFKHKYDVFFVNQRSAKDYSDAITKLYRDSKLRNSISVNSKKIK